MTYQWIQVQSYRKEGRESCRTVTWPSQLSAILEIDKRRVGYRGRDGDQRENGISGNHSVMKSGKHTWGVCRPNSNSFEPFRSNSCPGIEKSLESTADIPPPCVDFSPCLPDEVVRELERILRLDGAMTQERGLWTGYAQTTVENLGQGSVVFNIVQGEVGKRDCGLGLSFAREGKKMDTPPR